MAGPAERSLQGFRLWILDVLHQHPAAGVLPWADLAQRGLLGQAAVDAELAPRVELAARRHPTEIRRQSPDRDQALLLDLVDPRHGAQQRPGIRVLRVLEDGARRTLFDDPPGVHHD